MTFSATMFWHCKCGAEVHVIMECEDSDRHESPLSIHCWHCNAILGQVPAVKVATAANAQDALAAVLAKPERVG